MVVSEVRPPKVEPYRTRITSAGGHIKYPGDVSTPIGSLDLVKLMISSVLFRRNAKFVCFDAKNFYLQTPMARSEYVRIKLSDIPQEIIDEYNLCLVLIMVVCITRLSAAAMACHKLLSLPMTCLGDVWTKPATAMLPPPASHWNRLYC